MSSVTLVISLISNLSLPTCLLVTDESKITKTVTGIVAYSAITNLIFLLIGIIVVQYQNVSNVGNLPLNFQTIFLITSFSLLITITQVLANLNIREKSFGKNVIVNLSENSTSRAFSLSLGFLGFTKYGMFISDLAGKLINVLVQIFYKRIKVQLYFDSKYLSLKAIRNAVTWHKEYPMYYLPVQIVGSITSQFILWVLALFFSGSSVGHFTMAIGLLSIPLVLVSNSFQPLITSKLFNERMEFSFGNFFELAFKVFILSGLIYLLIYFMIPFFIGIYLGEKWAPSVQFIKILCVPFALQLVGNSIGGVFVVFNKQRINFVIKFVSLIILAIGCYWQINNKDELVNVVILYSLVLSIEELFRIIYIVLRLKNERSSKVL